MVITMTSARDVMFSVWFVCLSVYFVYYILLAVLVAAAAVAVYKK